jgi:hypothetical protein
MYLQLRNIDNIKALPLINKMSKIHDSTTNEDEEIENLFMRKLLELGYVLQTCKITQSTLVQPCNSPLQPTKPNDHLNKKNEETHYYKKKIRVYNNDVRVDVHS